MSITKLVYEKWGRPTDPDGCNGPYNDRDPVRRLTVEFQMSNNSNQYIPDHWHPVFYTANGAVPTTCIWYYDNTAIPPGRSKYVTFATHVASNDWVRAMVFDELGYELTICFNGAGQVVSCR